MAAAPAALGVAGSLVGFGNVARMLALAGRVLLVARLVRFALGHFKSR